MTAALRAARPRAGAVREPWSVGELLSRLVDAFVLGALWVVASLPVVTVLAAGAGADAVTSAWQRRRPVTVWATFWPAFRAALAPAVRAQLVLAVPVAAGVVDLAYAVTHRGELAGVVALGVGLLLVAASAAVGAAVPALVTMRLGADEAAASMATPARLGVRALLGDAALVAARSPGRTLATLGVLVLAGYAVVLMPAMLPLAVTATAYGVGALTRGAIRGAAAGRR